MYKIEKSDSTKCWFKLDELHDYPHLLEEFRQESKDQERKQKVSDIRRKQKPKSQNTKKKKLDKSNKGRTSGQGQKTPRNTNRRVATMSDSKKYIHNKTKKKN